MNPCLPAPGFLVEAAETAFGASPQGSAGIALDGPDVVVTESFGLRPGFPAMAAQPPDQPAAVDADPQRSLTVLRGHTDCAAGQPVRTADDMPGAVRRTASQPLHRRHENVSLPVLVDLAETHCWRQIGTFDYESPA